MVLLLLATLLRIIDGDTLHVRDGERDVKVRILGIDCPESWRNEKCLRSGADACEAQIPRGKAATKRARELLHSGDEVALEAHGVDRYGRTLAYVKLRDGRDFGLTLLREGVCADYSWKYPHPRQAEYRRATH